MGISVEISSIMAKRLKQLREKRGLTIEKLSKELLEKYGVKISSDSLLNYEVSDKNHTKAGKNQGMRVEYLRCLADFYGVSADYLLAMSDIQATDSSVQAIMQCTGLSESVVMWLRDTKEGFGEKSYTIEDINGLFEEPSFRNLLYTLCRHKKTIIAEHFYFRLRTDYPSETIHRAAFAAAVKECFETWQHNQAVNQILLRLLSTDGLDDNDGSCAVCSLTESELLPSDISEYKAQKSLLSLLADLEGGAVNQEFEAFREMLEAHMLQEDKDGNH